MKTLFLRFLISMPGIEDFADVDVPPGIEEVAIQTRETGTIYVQHIEGDDVWCQDIPYRLKDVISLHISMDDVA